MAQPRLVLQKKVASKAKFLLKKVGVRPPQCLEMSLKKSHLITLRAKRAKNWRQQIRIKPYGAFGNLDPLKRNSHFNMFT